MEGCQTTEKFDFHSTYQNETVTVNLFVILENTPRNAFDCAIKCLTSILLWAIQIHQHF